MKGIAIPFVMGLLIAMIVLAIAIFLIYLYVIQKKPLDCPECGAKFAAWCSKCYLNDCTGKIEMPEEVKQCVSECNLWTNPDNECNGAKEPCAAVGVPWCY